VAEKKMWSGRFKKKTAAMVEDYTESVGFDRRLYAVDIAGSKAHVRMLAAKGIISREDADKILDGLDRVLEEIETGRFEWRKELEDVHMNIESRLTEIIGEPGRKLHTGRSRNDQVALDFRLYVADRLEAWRRALAGLVSVLADRAKSHVGTPMPGFTHMQAAQPVSLAHHLLAYAWMFRRDHARVGDCLTRVRVSPLGAAALAGTTYDLDPEAVAREVGFPEVFANSMDAVSDRDFVIESLSAGAVIMMHLSRLCEEIVIWASPGYGFVVLPDEYSTGSSIMPQKKNPDVAEIMRGKTGRVYGALVSLLATMKGLPLAYNRDMQEDKEPFFDTDETVTASLEIMAGMMEAVKFKPEVMREALVRGYLNATELADYLAGKGVSFREAHRIAGRAVAMAEKRGLALEDLSPEDFQSLSPVIQDDVYLVLSYDKAVSRRDTHGGTGAKAVKKQIDELAAWLEEVARG